MIYKFVIAIPYKQEGGSIHFAMLDIFHRSSGLLRDMFRKKFRRYSPCYGHYIGEVKDDMLEIGEVRYEMLDVVYI